MKIITFSVKPMFRLGVLILFALSRGALFPNVHAQAFPLFVSTQGDNRIYKVMGNTATVFAQTGLSNPAGLVFDNRTNLYVANFGSNTIVKFDRTGHQTIFAAVGLSGPQGLAIDSLGFIYAANSSNNTVVRFDSAGNESLFASTGLSNPQGLAFDAQDNLYVANNLSGTVRKFSAAGVDLGVFAAGLNQPRGVSADNSGHIYVTTFGDSKIEQFGTNGTGGPYSVFTNLVNPIGVVNGGIYLYVVNYGNGKIYGNSGPAQTEVAGLNAPAFVAIQPTKPPVLFISNQTMVDNNDIETSFMLELSFSQELDERDILDGYGTGRPYGVAADRLGNIFVANFYSNTIVEITPDQQMIYVADTPDGLNLPTGLAVDGAGNLYVANFGNNTIFKYFRLTNGKYLKTIFANTGLSNPEGIALDASTNVYVANYSSGSVLQYTANGVFLGVFAAGFQNPVGLAFDSNGNLYVTDFGGSIIQRLAPDGNDGGTLSGPGISHPQGITVDEYGNFYVANYYLSSIEEFSASGNDLGVFANFTNEGIIQPTFLTVQPPLLPAPVPLKIQVAGTNVVVGWPGTGFNLQSSPTIKGPFANVPGAYSPYPVSPSNSPMFFRLKAN